MSEKEVVGGCCLWGVDEHLRSSFGISKTEVGQSGGNTKNPTYETVCYQNTDHAEVLQLDFDDEIISYATLVDEFWKCHDPTTIDRQGPDIGRQYRSVIYYFDEFQKKVAETSRGQHQTSLNKMIVTEITKADTFYKAEEYHQKYIQKRAYS